MIGCGGGSPCDQVLNSRWSSVAGVVPISGLAAGAYLAMLVASLFVGPATESSVRNLAWRAVLILVGAAAGSAVWFIILQKWMIGAFCPYCMATHITGLVLATLMIWQAPKQLDTHATDAVPTTPVEVSSAKQRVIGRWPAIGLVALGLGLAGIMAACQVYFVPPAVYRDGESKATPSALDPHSAPLIGSPNAVYVVNLLFDFKCPHCQRLHLMLDETIRRYNGKLAFVLCPTPLNTQCNPYIPRDTDEFKGSCELAKIALTVWVAKREAFPAFDRWMFSFETGDLWHPRRLEAARAKAIELVGAAKFEAAENDPWIEKYLQASIQIYGNTTQTDNHAVPRLVYGSRWVVPEPNNADDLVAILHDSLALPLP